MITFNVNDLAEAEVLVEQYGKLYTMTRGYETIRYFKNEYEVILVDFDGNLEAEVALNYMSELHEEMKW